MRYEVSWNWRFGELGGSGFDFFRRIKDAKAAATSLAEEYAAREEYRVDIIDRWRGNELVFHKVKVDYGIER